MNHVANALMRSRRAKPAVYTAPGSSAGVPIRVVVDDSAGEVRLRNGREITADTPEGTVFESVGAQIDGRIEASGTIYRIDGTMDSTAPGLQDLALTRVSGPALEGPDLSKGIIRSLKEIVMLDGRMVKASVTRRSISVEHDGYGEAIRTTRTLVSVANADLQGAEEGAVVVLNGKRLHVVRVNRTGAGLTTLVC